ncbi:MAG: ribbon-helix-helix protein, CopG family [Armatimonadota bacterium]
MSREMVAALDRVAREAGCTREAVIREYVAESLPEGWLQHQRRR